MNIGVYCVYMLLYTDAVTNNFGEIFIFELKVF